MSTDAPFPFASHAPSSSQSPRTVNNPPFGTTPFLQRFGLHPDLFQQDFSSKNGGFYSPSLPTSFPATSLSGAHLNFAQPPPFPPSHSNPPFCSNANPAPLHMPPSNPFPGPPSHLMNQLSRSQKRPRPNFSHDDSLPSSAPPPNPSYSQHVAASFSSGQPPLPQQAHIAPPSAFSGFASVPGLPSPFYAAMPGLPRSNTAHQTRFSPFGSPSVQQPPLAQSMSSSAPPPLGVSSNVKISRSARRAGSARSKMSVSAPLSTAGSQVIDGTTTGGRSRSGSSGNGKGKCGSDDPPHVQSELESLVSAALDEMSAEVCLVSVLCLFFSLAGSYFLVSSNGNRLTITSVVSLDRNISSG